MIESTVIYGGGGGARERARRWRALRMRPTVVTCTRLRRRRARRTTSQVIPAPATRVSARDRGAAAGAGGPPSTTTRSWSPTSKSRKLPMDPKIIITTRTSTWTCADSKIEREISNIKSTHECGRSSASSRRAATRRSRSSRVVSLAASHRPAGCASQDKWVHRSRAGAGHSWPAGA